MRKPAKENAKPMSPADLEALRSRANDVLAECRRQLLSPGRSPFVGSIAMNLNIEAVHDRRCPTAMTDGSTIYFDIDFLSNLSPEDRLFVFAHEVWHNVMCHFTRMTGGRDKNLRNIAEDLEVNQILRDDGFAVPKDGLLPRQYNLPEGLSAEEYYERLVQQQKKNNKGGGNQGQGGGAGGGSGGSSGGQNGKNQKNQKNQQQQNQNQQQDQNSQGGNSEGKLQGQFDRHVDPDYDPSMDQSGQGQQDKYGALGEDPNFKPNVKPGQQEKMRELAVAAAQQVQRQRGTLPAHLQRLVQDLLEPEIPWQEVLAQFITRAIGDKNRWSRPNRRFVHQGIYLPSKDGERIKIAVGIDTSGSTAGDIKKFLSEVNAIIKPFSNYELHLIQCDAEVQDYTLYNEENPLDLENTEFKVCGGGGTAMQPIFDYIEKEELDVDAIAIFTDGYIERFPASAAPDIPTMWIVTEDGMTESIGFGEILKFEREKNRDAA